MLVLKVVECGSLETLEAFRIKWNDLIDRSDSATVFSGWEWAEAFRKFSAPGKRPVILLAIDEKDGRLAGVLPLAQTRRLGVLRAFEVLGCNPQGYPMADYGGLTAERGGERAVWVAMLHYLKRKRWSVLDLRNCTVLGRANEEQTIHFYMEAAAELGWRVSVRPSDTCRIMPLPPTFQEYLAGLSSNSRQNIRRKLRKLEEAGLTVEQINSQDEAAFNQAFDALIEYHQARWAEDPSGGGFATQSARDLHRQLARQLGAAGQLDLRAVRAGSGEILGVMYNLRWKGVGYFYALGASQDEKYSSLSLGTCLLAKSIEGAIASNCHSFNLLRGDHEYKRHFGGYQVNNLRVTVYRHGWVSKLEATKNTARAALRYLQDQSWVTRGKVLIVN